MKQTDLILQMRELITKELIKPIRLQDKERVLEIASDTWEGGDYISSIFDEWIMETDGFFVGLWKDDTLIAFGKMSILSPGEIWLEGLRKDQNLNIQGVGRKLATYMLDQLKHKAVRSIRFTTYFGNTESIVINEKLGFEKIGTFSLKTLTIPEKIIEQPIEKPEKLISLPEVESFLISSEYFIKLGRLIPKGWVLYSYTTNYLQKMIKLNRLIMFKENGSIRGMLIYDLISYKDILWISFIEAETPEIYKYLIDKVLILGSVLEKRKLQMTLPDIRALKEFCSKTGFSSWEKDDDFLLYEFPIKKLHGNKNGP